MQRISILLFLLVFCSATAMQAQAPAPKPDPALKKLHVMVGHWTGEGEAKPGPWGPGRKYTFEETDDMILGGFFLQTRVTFKETGRHDLWIVGYDPVNKNYPVSHYTGTGHVSSGIYAIDGNTWTYAGKLSVAGKQYLIRVTLTFAADLMSFTDKGEISVDGKTWTSGLEEKITKIKPAPKK